MQTKHLHLILLVLLVAGCGSSNNPVDNPYLHDQKAVALSFSRGSSEPAMLFGNIDFAAAKLSSSPEPFVFQVHPHSSGWLIGGLQVDGFDRRSAMVRRTLSSLIVEDTLTGLRYAATVLPKGEGLAFYLEGETYSPVRFTLAHSTKDTVFLRGNKTGKQQVYLFPDSIAVVLHYDPQPQDFKILYGGSTHSITREFDQSKHWQVVMAFDKDPDTADRVASAYVGWPREKLEAATLDSLAAQLAFVLRTEDDDTNLAFALLAAALCGANGRLSTASAPEIEHAASLASGLFLASRIPSPVVFSAGEELGRFMRVGWGAEAYRDVLRYGMASDDSLGKATLDLLSQTARLSASYLKNLFAISDNATPDTLLRLAIAHMRYADLLTLCGDVAALRGDRAAETGYRREASRAARNSRRFFEQESHIYRTARGELPEETTLLLDTYSDGEDSTEPSITLHSTSLIASPDTSRFVRAGAYFGFNWLGEHPQDLVGASLDGFTWQKWTAYRFANDLSITDTPDLDSALTLILHGPVPGTLTADPGHDGEPSSQVMAVLFENLAELYLGVHPDWMKHRVDLLPRPPQGWGHTVARVPLGTGHLRLDYDFDNSRAAISMVGIDRKLDVFFGYPLPSGGFTRTQFALSPDEPSATVRMHRDSQNRVKLDVITD